MPTYEYECTACGTRFERRQAVTDPPNAECPECHGKARRLVSGGAGFIMKGSGHGGSSRGSQTCSLEQGGKTCCGRDERCGKPPCKD
ncbi:MAG: FmdB family zinc ribbon protein [bacterium]